MKMTYSEQLRHPYWQRKRLEVLSAAGFACVSCGDTQSTLNVHHKCYVKGRMAWEYDFRELEVLCEPCHLIIHKEKAGLDAEIAALDHFEYAWLHDFLLGRRQAFVSLTTPDEYVDAKLSADTTQAAHAYYCGRLVECFVDLSAEDIASIVDAFNQLNPAGFMKTITDGLLK